MVSWCSSNIYKDEGWVFGMLDVSDIWTGVIDFSKL